MWGTYVTQLRELIDEMVLTAFTKIYSVEEDKCWINVEEVSLDYSTNEACDDYPLIRLKVRVGYLGEISELELNLFPEESKHYNIGHLASAFERLESDQ